MRRFDFNRMARLGVLVVLLVLFKLVIPDEVMGQAVFFDTFPEGGLNSSKWDVIDTGDNYDLSYGEIRVSGGIGTPVYGDPAIYSKDTFERVVGRTLFSIVRPTVATSEGPVIHFAPTQFDDPPFTVGNGMMLAPTGGSAPVGRIGVLSSNGVVTIRQQESSADVAITRSIDYALATVLQSSGAVHLVSGGAFGTWPTARVVWVEHDESSASGYVGVSSKDTIAGVSEVQLVDIDEYSSDYALATVVDNFGRSGSLDGSTPDGKGGDTWNSVLGSFTLDGTSAQVSGTARAVVDVDTEGIYETLATSQGDDFLAGVMFRYVDSDNFWVFYGNASTYGIGHFTGGSFTTVDQTGAEQFGYNQSKRLSVVVKDNSICPYADGELVLGSCYDSSVHAAGSQAGIYSFSSTNLQFEDFHAYPAQVSFPDGYVDFPTVPTAGSTVLASDSFTDSDATTLEGHTMDSGSGWTEVSQNWSISSNEAVVDADDALVITDVGSSDVAVEVDITMPAAGLGTSEWFAGVVLRYTDTNNYIWARFLWQAGSPEIEIWEVIDGVSSAGVYSEPGFANATNIRDKILEDETHTLRLAARGNQVAAFLDGELMVQGLVSLTTGTQVGMIINNLASTPLARFDNFEVRDVVADSVGPSEIDTLSVNASGTDAVLSWNGVNDDTSESVDYYRVYRSSVSGSLGVQINADSSTQTASYTDTTLTTSGLFYYTVRGVDMYGNEQTGSNNIAASFVSGITAPSTTSANDNSSGGGGPPPGCGDSKILGTPWVFTGSSTTTSATIYFSPTLEAATNRIVRFGYWPGDDRFGVTLDRGSATGVNEITLYSLSPGTKYFVAVRWQNGCATGGWSNEYEVSTQRVAARRLPSVSKQVNQVVPESTPIVAISPTPTVTSTERLESVSEKVVEPTVQPFSQETEERLNNPPAVATPMASIQPVTETSSETGLLDRIWGWIKGLVGR